ncbi:MAG: pyridoxal phosphate-dependent aminotransferase [Alphaproteobacteria bacterium]
MARSDQRFVPATPSGTALDHVSRQMAMLEKQLIVQVVEMARDAPDVIALWFGESDLDTPDVAKDAAMAALARGETHYTHQNGIPPLRQALATYMAGLYGRDFDSRRITVASGGMSAIMMALQTVLSAGDHMVIVTPLWPNAFGVCRILGAEYSEVPMVQHSDGWSLDLDRLFAAVGPRTRALYIATPGNPTGWIMEHDQQQAVLDFCRARGLWLIADEVYIRLAYESDLPRGRAPSFLDVADPDDRLIVINSFSKSWSMTGWRLGWIAHPADTGHAFEKLVEYNIANPTTFVQYAGVAAIRDGEPFIAETVERYRRNRDIVVQRLGAMKRVTLSRPDGAFYAFFAVDGMTDSVAFAQQLIDEVGVGLAPGRAFSEDGEGWMRLCFAADTQTVSAAMDRLAPVLG